MEEIRPGVRKRCSICRGFLDATTVRRAQAQRDGVIAVIFRRTIPVLRCPVCDARPTGPAPRLWAPPR